MEITIFFSPKLRSFIPHLSFRDVSQTGITSLPTTGMDSVRELKARDAWALKKLPPIKTFKHLTVANLTYPSHCCGFKNLKKKRGCVCQFFFFVAGGV